MAQQLRAVERKVRFYFCRMGTQRERANPVTVANFVQHVAAAETCNITNEFETNLNPSFLIPPSFLCLLTDTVSKASSVMCFGITSSWCRIRQGQFASSLLVSHTRDSYFILLLNLWAVICTYHSATNELNIYLILVRCTEYDNPLFFLSSHVFSTYMNEPIMTPLREGIRGASALLHGKLD